MAFSILYCIVFFIGSGSVIGQDYPLPPRASSDSCSFGLDEVISSPFDCWPEAGAEEQGCLNRGCCWHESSGGRPFCYFPEGFSSFDLINGTNNLQRKYRSQFPEDVNLLRLDILPLPLDHLAFRIVDASKDRWIPPYPKIDVDWSAPIKSTYVTATYEVQVREGDQLMKVTRSGKKVLAVESSTLMFSDQFIQLTFDLEKTTLYGIGEHRTRLALNDRWTKYTLWTHDGVPQENANLYGSHPFLLAVDESGNATGIYFHNSNAIEVAVQPGPKVTFRSIGGILEFHYFLGPSPADVISQYTKLVGLPAMPPYWALGFHLCRWGYGSANQTRAVWQRMRDKRIPFDVQWNDIDYMRQNNDFTVDPVNFAELPQLVNDIHDAGMHYVSMLDPGVSGSEEEGTYPPYSDGIEMDVFVKDINGDVFLGHVWNPDRTVYPDFTHPKVFDYWSKQLREFREKIKFDALWIDMNEPSNFADGTPDGCPQSKLETPPFVPTVEGGQLQAKTLCMTAQHSAGTHYNMHNLFGISEADITKRAAEAVIGKRTFLISRASFSGLGRYSGHWSGDNNSSWGELVASVIELITFSIYGVPLMGADICGFGGEPDRELCNRWSQLGAFYTFSRNHNTIGTKDQDPAVWDDEVVDSIRKALELRYSLLPYLYTLFYEAQENGTTVARPLFFEFPADSEARRVDRAFLWGSALYIIPVLEPGATSVNAYIPNARWFDFVTGEELIERGNVTLSAPFDKIPVLIRGGSIVPQQSPAVTTTASRKNSISFAIAPDQEGNAKGSLFWDDGESLDPVNNGKFGLVNVTLSGRKIQSSPRVWNTDALSVASVSVYGISSASGVTVNGLPATFEIRNNQMIVDLRNQVLSSSFVVTWD